MNDTQNLEHRLRDHYQAKAAELRLPDVTLDDVLAGRTAPMRVDATPRRGRTTLLVAAALVGGAVVGAGALQLARDEPSAGNQPTEVPTAESGELPGGAPFAPCSGDPLPSDLASRSMPNDIRVARALLPAATPDGHCVYDHRVVSDASGGESEYEVFTDCGSCERPAAAIARLHTGQDLESNETGQPQSVDVGDYAGTFYAPDDTNPLGRLYVDTGADFPITFVGWGRDAAGFAEVAEALTSDQYPYEVPGMQVVTELALLPQYTPGLIPFAATLNVWYSSDSGESFLRYAVLEDRDAPPLEAYAWVRPNPVFTTVDGRATVSFPASASRDGTQEAIVITQVDETSQAMWSSRGTTPMSPDDLAAIALTPAPADDPRWAEIAWESGCSECVG